MAQPGSPARQRGLILALLAIALFASVGAAILVVAEERLAGFLVVLCAGSALLLAGEKTSESSDARLRFADSLVDRTVDAVILGTVVWVAFPEKTEVAAAALAALVAAYLASYLRARAVGLGFRVEETLLQRSARMPFVALSVLEAPALAALWVATAISLQAVIVRARTVARQREIE
jgi:hypothetical protein